MHVLYVGYYVNQNIFDEILEKSAIRMSVARQILETSLIKGLYEYLGENIDFISYVPVNKTINIPEFSELEGAKVNHIPIQKDNIKSMVSASKQFEKYLLGLGKDKLKDLRIVMYAVNPIFLLPILKLKRKYKFKITTICSEAPAIRRYNNSFKAQIQKRITIFFNKKFDNYVLLTDKMREVVDCRHKPTMVLEGMSSPVFCEPQKGKKNIVMYAGSLAADNNISLLVDSCREIEELDELWICGSYSPETEYVIEAQKEDPRIQFLGRLENEEVRRREIEAKLLINLRSLKDNRGRYTFPSKIFEYIGSGGIVLSTKLAGIPDEYFDYMLTVEEDTKEEVIEKIRYCFSMDDEQYVDFCKKSQKFITEEKNYLKQSQKLVDFIINN